MQTEQIHIALSFDQNYVGQFYTLAASIIAHTDNICFHAITSGITPERKGEISRYIRERNNQVAFYTPPEDFGKGIDVKHWTLATYYRLLFPGLLPEHIGRFIYLDTDMLAVNDIRTVLSYDLKDNIVGAVLDPLIGARPELGIYEDGKDFNAGFLLIDRRRWLQEGITEKALKQAVAHPEYPYVDQDSLNFLLKNKWLKLPYGYNTMYAYLPFGLSRREAKAFIADKYVLHFTLDRPWLMLSRHPYRYLYRRHQQRSPARHLGRYADAAAGKLPAWIKIRLIDLYLNSGPVRAIWRRMKK